jgi:HEPN domain-containing protein
MRLKKKTIKLTENERRVYRNNFATRCFREVADKDYIAARTNYRFGLVEPFLWSALQAIEKYLKSILLYNDCSTKNLGHKVAKAFNRVMRIPHLMFDFPPSVDEFIQYLTKHASSRYLERPYYTRGQELLRLDHTVWHLRRYCQDLQAAPKGIDRSVMLELNLQRIDSKNWENKPQRFRISGGFLEHVLEGHSRTEVREALIWNNPYYGDRFRRKLRNYKLRSQSANPPHYLHRKSYFAVKDLVFFSKDVVADMQSRWSGD